MSNASHDVENKKNEFKEVTGKELSEIEEIDIKIGTLVDLLDSKNIINKKEYQRNLMMHLHEASKARAFEQLDKEL